MPKLLDFKDPAEDIVVEFDFSEVATSLSNVSVTCVAQCGTDAAAQAMVSGSPTTSGGKAYQTIINGIVGVRYGLECKVDTPDQTLVLAATLPVRDARSTNIPPSMLWTKRQLVEMAYAELSLAGYVFDLSPEEMEMGLRRLDTMWAMWEAKGILMGYTIPSTPFDSDLDQDSGLPALAIEPTYLNLAIRLAPGNGKQISSDTRRSAREGYASLLIPAAMPRQQQMPDTLPVGSGNKTWGSIRGPFFPPPCREWRACFDLQDRC